MNRQESLLSRHIREALTERASHGIPGHADLWPRLQLALAQSQISGGYGSMARSGRRIIVAIALCAALLIGSVGIAAAGSPALRHFLQETVLGIPSGDSGAAIDAQGQPLQIQPLPPFTLFYPASQPSGLAVRGVGQLHPRYGTAGFGARYDCPTPPAPCPPGTTLFIPPHPSVGVPSLLTPFQDRATDVVWFGSRGIPPDQRFIQIVEWDATTSPVKSLTAADVPALVPGKAETLLVQSQDGTTIAIDTDMGSSVAQQVADSLQPLTPSAR